MYDFATVDLSSVYFDVLKDRLYTSATRSHARRSAQTALYRLTLALARLLAPILSFTTDEVWNSLKLAGNVHTAEFPTPEELLSGIPEAQRSRLANWDRLLPLRQEVLKKLEAARQEKVIGAPLEAAVRIAAGSASFQLLREYEAELPGLFIVSQVHLSNHVEEPGAVEIAVERAAGLKCESCWKYTTDTGANADFPTICAPCADAVVEMTANA